MKNRLIKFLGAFLVIAVGTFYGCDQPLNTNGAEEPEEEIVSETGDPIPGQYIVVFKEIDGKGKVASVRDNILSKNAIASESIITKYDRTVQGFAAKLDKAQLEKIKADSRVDYVEQDRIVKLAPPGACTPWPSCRDDDGGDDDDGGGGTDTQETPYGITRVNGGATYTGSNAAWVIDSGIDLDHPDLNVDASRGFNAFTKGKDGKSLDDGDGHGSHVAGTIAAVDNTEGVIGVAAGATVIPVKVLDSRGSGSYSGVIAGVEHVGANGSSGDVANMSLGGPTSQALDDAVLAASSNGITFSIAAGNSGEDANSSSPARVNGQYIVTISAMDSNDDWASFSNFGNPPVDYAAPGVGITSTWKDGGYQTISGTSMAAPHAAGVLLLGAANTDGTVNGDPDGDADPIIVN